MPLLSDTTVQIIIFAIVGLAIYKFLNMGLC